VHYDYLLTRNELRDYGLVPQTGAELLATDGSYRLYKVRKTN